MEKSGKNIYDQQFVRPYYAYYWKNKVSSLGSATNTQSSHIPLGFYKKYHIFCLYFIDENL